MHSTFKSLVRTLKSAQRSNLHPQSSLLSLSILLSPRSFSSSPSIEAPKPQTLEGLRHRLAIESPTLGDFIKLQSNNDYSVKVGTKKKPLPKPKWMKESITGGEKYTLIKKRLRELKLHTICGEAKCPNLGECWSDGEIGTATALIMILGDTCTPTKARVPKMPLKIKSCDNHVCFLSKFLTGHSVWDEQGTN